MASLPLPSDRLRLASTTQATRQRKDTKILSQNPRASLPKAQHCSKRFAQPTAGTKATHPTVDVCCHPSRQGGSRQSSAVSTSSMLDAEADVPSAAESTAAESTAAESVAAAEAAAVADDIPIQPLNKQTADGTCVSPKIGRRSTPFSTSEPSHLSASKERQDASATTAEGFSQQNTTLQGDMIASRSMGDAKDLAEGRWQEGIMQEDQQEPSSAIAGDCTGASADSGDQPDGCEQRPYLTCCVRLSEEKEPHRQGCIGHLCIQCT